MLITFLWANNYQITLSIISVRNFYIGLINNLVISLSNSYN